MLSSVNLYQRTTEPTMNPFTSTIMNYDRVQDRRRSFEQAAARRRLFRFDSRTGATTRHPSRPPGPVQFAPVLSLVDATVSGDQHLPALPVGEPTTARVA
jgi:hypothetical protein